MTREEKQLLLKDLCARLPYKPHICIKDGKVDVCTDIVLYGTYIHDWITVPSCQNMTIKPYLRPMSSMTEEDLRDFAKIKFKDNVLWEIVEFPEMKCYKGFINVKCKHKNNGDTWIFQVNTRTPLETYYGIDWLLAHHFDYRSLIEKGLALEAPNGMYKTE